MRAIYTGILAGSVFSVSALGNGVDGLSADAFYEFTADASGLLPAVTPGFLQDENVSALTTTFNPTTQQFTFEATLTPNTVGSEVNSFSLVIGDGNALEGRTGEIATLYFDATREGTPVVSLYTYNGADSATSFRFADFQQAAVDGSVAPDTLATSFGAGTGADFLNGAAVVENADGSRTFSVDIDASEINGHVPTVASPDGGDFFGLQVAQELGIWFHTFQQTFETTYDENGFFVPETGNANLVATGFAVASNFNTLDLTGLQAVLVPEPATAVMALTGLGLLAGRRRRA